MPRFDYRCPKCERTEEMQEPTWEGSPCLPCCKFCCGPVTMEKLPSAPNFTVKGFNAKNGYAK